MSLFLSTIFLEPDMEPRIFYMFRKYLLHCTLVQQELYTVLVHMLSLWFLDEEKGQVFL